MFWVDASPERQNYPSRRSALNNNEARERSEQSRDLHPHRSGNYSTVHSLKSEWI
jgi:hypothetical protein